MVKGVVSTSAVTEASLVYVAVNENGRPRALPSKAVKV